MIAGMKAMMICILLSGCTQQIVTHYEGATTGAFTEVNRLETNLKRGVSTKSDVQRVLGAPMGSGSALFPTDPMAREIWSYHDIELTDVKLYHVIQLDMRRQILLVFFRKEVFDGFMWYSNLVPGTAKSQ
jgi:hypothetical protein